MTLSYLRITYPKENEHQQHKLFNFHCTYEGPAKQVTPYHIGGNDEDHYEPHCHPDNIKQPSYLLGCFIRKIKDLLCPRRQFTTPLSLFLVFLNQPLRLLLDFSAWQSSGLHLLYPLITQRHHAFDPPCAFRRRQSIEFVTFFSHPLYIARLIFVKNRATQLCSVAADNLAYCLLISGIEAIPFVEVHHNIKADTFYVKGNRRFSEAIYNFWE